jgi:hypothetical protein
MSYKQDSKSYPRDEKPFFEPCVLKLDCSDSGEGWRICQGAVTNFMIWIYALAKIGSGSCPCAERERFPRDLETVSPAPDLAHGRKRSLRHCSLRSDRLYFISVWSELSDRHITTDRKVDVLRHMIVPSPTELVLHCLLSQLELHQNNDLLGWDDLIIL